MACSLSNSHSEPAKVEQIITEFFAKSLHIILESRSPYVSSRNYSGEQFVSSPSSSSSSSSSIRPRDKWFNLALRDCSAALENLDLWRQSNLEPMVVDVILVQRPYDWDPIRYSSRKSPVRNFSSKDRIPALNYRNSGQDDFPSDVKNETIIERWVVQYETRKSKESTSGIKRTCATSFQSMYKKSIILLRSLYLTVKLLPAYKLFRDLSSSGQIRTFTLAHRVSSFVEPFTSREEAEMHQFGFPGVDTPCGRLNLSVLYRPALSDVSSESTTPISPQFIPDYVGSPATDPLKRFPSLPLSGIGLVPQGSPSSVPFARRHSWGYDLYRASAPSLSPSPSPTYSDSRALSSNPSSCRLPRSNLPCYPHDTPSLSNASLVHKKNTSFDEYWPSPTFSPSPSPSPPTYFPASHMSSKALLRSESAPVSIPTAKPGRIPSSSNNNMLPPSTPPKGTAENVPPPVRKGDTPTNITAQKVPFSRSPSKLFFQDEFDDPDFAGSLPFVVGDDDITGQYNRGECFDGKGDINEGSGGLLGVRQSQDAAVGALVHMFKTAQSIQQPPSAILLKTTADALEEFQSYKEMKDLLLSQGSGS